MLPQLIIHLVFHVFLLLHQEWYSDNLLVIFLLPECMSIVSHLMNLAIE